MRGFLWMALAAGLLWGADKASTPAPATFKPGTPKPVTLSDAPRKKGGKHAYRAAKPHTAKRAKDANKRIRGPKQAHPVWGNAKVKH